MSIRGYATLEGTRRYAERFADRAVDGHFRRCGELWLSSLGIGTYLGEPDAATDGLYAGTVAATLERGANVVDAAINYRFQRSERSVGRALAALVDQGKLARDEVVVSTKGGFLTPDAEDARDPRTYFSEEYISRGVLRPEEVVGGMHCLTPAYLEDQLGRSRRNLGLETIDIYYLHNPETQLPAVPREEFLRRVAAAFERLEQCVARGWIRVYGTATWDGYRRPPGAADYLSLAELVQVAERVAGADHHFRVVQLPINLAMPEAAFYPTQRVDGESVPLLEAARRLGVIVFASASILQGQVARGLPAELRSLLGPGLASDAQRALQFVRSLPGLGAALVGMRRLEHVEENLRLMAEPLLPPETYRHLMQG